MNKEEVIKRLESIKETYETFAGGLDDIHLDIDALEYSIGYLKEIVKILGKIKDEIKDVAFDLQEIDGEHESIIIVELNDALNIIDKYK